jgi:hypothetical protein
VGLFTYSRSRTWSISPAVWNHNNIARIGVGRDSTAGSTSVGDFHYLITFSEPFEKTSAQRLTFTLNETITYANT